MTIELSLKEAKDIMSILKYFEVCEDDEMEEKVQWYYMMLSHKIGQSTNELQKELLNNDNQV